MLAGLTGVCSHFIYHLFSLPVFDIMFTFGRKVNLSRIILASLVIFAKVSTKVGWLYYSNG